MVFVFPSIGFFISIVAVEVAVRRLSNALATSAKAMLVEPPPIMIQETENADGHKDGCGHGELGDAFHLSGPFHGNRNHIRFPDTLCRMGNRFRRAHAVQDRRPERLGILRVG